MTYTIAHIVDGFGHGASIFEGNMNEYRHMTYSIHVRPWIQFLQMALHKGSRTQQLKLQKSSYRPYTLQLFFTTATIYSTVLYMDKDYYKDFSEKSL